MASVLPPFVEALPDGVVRVSLPTPFHVGRVNCYLLVDPPVTVIDPGTLQAGSIDELAAALASSGLGLGDVEQIVVTHAHPDHFGAAAAIAARSGAGIVCGLPERAGLLGPSDSQWTRELLVGLGVPAAAARSLSLSPVGGSAGSASSRQQRRASFLQSRAHVVPMHRMQRLRPRGTSAGRPLQA